MCREIYTYRNIKLDEFIYTIMTSRRDTICIVHLDERTQSHTISTRAHVMNDYDASYIWDYEVSAHDYLDESYTHDIQNTWDLDDEYARDSHDYTQLAYIHFA